MIGQTLAYSEITALLDKGGMGEVSRARDTKLGREVALELMPTDLADVADRLARRGLRDLIPATERVLSREPLFSGAYLQYRWFSQFVMLSDGGHSIVIENPRRGDVEVITRWSQELQRTLAAAN